MDGIPLFSQAKSFVQWVCDDTEGAVQTQVNFSKQCPLVSQVRSAMEALSGDHDAALNTQKEFGGFVESVVNGIPVIGHLKGTLHYALGDMESGDTSMKAASHTAAVIGGGVGGFVAAGPFGAVAGGIGAGVAIDSAITAADSAINNEFRPYGALEPLADPANPGKWCDAAGGLLLDGLAAKTASKVGHKIHMKDIFSTKVSTTESKAFDAQVLKSIIPKSLVPFVKQIRLMMKTNSGRIFFKVFKAGQKHFAKKMSSFSVSNEEWHCGDFSSVTEEVAKDLEVRFEGKGDLVEVYYKNKLILIKNGDLKYISKCDGGLEQVMEGFIYFLNDDGTFITKCDEECVTDESSNRRSNWSVCEDALEEWFDAREELEEICADIQDPVTDSIPCSDSSEHDPAPGITFSSDSSEHDPDVPSYSDSSEQMLNGQNGVSGNEISEESVESFHANEEKEEAWHSCMRKAVDKEQKLQQGEEQEQKNRGIDMDKDNVEFGHVAMNHEQIEMKQEQLSVNPKIDGDENQNGDKQIGQNGDKQIGQNGNGLQEQNGNGLQEQNGDELLEQNGDEQREQNGNELLEQNGDELVEQNGDDLVEQNGDELVEQNEDEQREQNGDELLEQNGDELLEQNGDERREPNGDEQREPNGDEQRERNGDEQRERNGDEQREQNGDEQREQNGDEQREQNGGEQREQNGDEQRDQNGDEQRDQNGDEQREQNGDVELENILNVEPHESKDTKQSAATVQGSAPKCKQTRNKKIKHKHKDAGYEAGNEVKQGNITALKPKGEVVIQRKDNKKMRQKEKNKKKNDGNLRKKAGHKLEEKK